MRKTPDPTELHRAIEQVIQRWIALESNVQAPADPDVRIHSCRSVSGGCISETQILTLDDGRDFFVKSNQQLPGLFAAEAKGLAAIGATNAIRVPNVIGSGLTESGIGFLVLESIDNGSPGKDFEAEFGRSLAQMHRNGRSTKFGFDFDNYLGSSNQVNNWSPNWVEFWATCRMGYQIKLAQDNKHASAEFVRRCERVISRLDELIGIETEPALIHGDLWSGNFIVSSEGRPVLIDPAPYFGTRESEFGMTTLFGGFGPRFYDSYDETWPLIDGWQDRVEIYRLYHLMNHLNLFGASYLGGCMEILRKFS